MSANKGWPMSTAIASLILLNSFALHSWGGSSASPLSFSIIGTTAFSALADFLGGITDQNKARLAEECTAVL